MSQAVLDRLATTAQAVAAAERPKNFAIYARSMLT